MITMIKEKTVVTSIRIPVSTLLQVDKLARDGKETRTTIICECLEEALASKRGMSEIRQIIEDSQGWFGGIDVDGFVENLKGRKPLSLYERAYLAKRCEYQTRIDIFEKLGLKDELNRVNTIDQILHRAKEQRGTKMIYNIYTIINDIKHPLNDFEMEYLHYHLSQEDIDKLTKARPDITPKELEDEEEGEEDLDEGLEEEEGEEEEDLDEETEDEEGEGESEKEEEIPIIDSKKP